MRKTLSILAAAATLAAALAGLVGADAFHHFGAGGLGSRLHHITTWGFASATPDGLATHGDGFALFAWLRAETVNHLNGNGLFGEALDVLHEAFFVQADQVDGSTVVAGATGAADTMDMDFRVMRQLEIDHRRQILDIQPPGSDIGRHQHRAAFVGETQQHLLAVTLLQITMQRQHIKTLALQQLADLTAIGFGIAENHRRFRPVVHQQFHDRLRLVAVGDFDKMLLDMLVFTRGFDGDFHRGILDRRTHGLDGVGISRGKQQGLPTFGRVFDDLANIVFKTHVEHAVGFIQHQRLHLGQADGALVHVVEQAARRGDDDIDAAP